MLLLPTKGVSSVVFDIGLETGFDALDTQLVMLTVHARRKIFNSSGDFRYGAKTDTRIGAERGMSLTHPTEVTLSCMWNQDSDSDGVWMGLSC